jgi:TonB-linked SusC/RagA family outer membrane protein
MFSLLVFFISAAQLLFAQTGTITGTVSDSNGSGLPGVNVLVKGTSSGTATDFDGNYSISASQGDVLVFSFIGFATKEATVTGSSLNVVLEEDANELDEVVVTAFGIQKESKELGYSVTQIKTEDLDAAGQMNGVTALQGRVAGLTINQTSGSAGGGVDILIRGVSSINPGSNNQPLIIVDGVAINNDTFAGNVLPSSGSNSPTSQEQFSYTSRAGDVNPEDVESYNVLKGAAATALYGVRAANGAIIITTKKGKLGKAKVTFTANTTFRKVTKFPEQQKIYREGFLGAPRTLYTPETETGFTRVGSGTPFYSWGPKYSDDSYDFGDGDVVDLSNDKYYDYNKDLFKTGMNSQVNFNIAGADKNIDYFFSIGNSRDESIVPNSNYDKTTVRFNGGYQATDNFKISSSIAYSRSGGRRANGGDKSIISSLAYFSPTFPINDYLNPDGSQRNYTPFIDNPRYFAEKSSLEDEVNRWIGNVTFNWTPKQWLNVVYTAQVDNYSDQRNRFVPPVLDVGTQVGGFVIDENINFFGIESNLLVTMTKDWSSDFNTTLTLGNQISDQKRVYNRMYGERLNIPDLNHISNTTIRDNSNDVTQERNVGVFGELKFGYKEKLFLTVTGRNDWVSTLPSSNNSFFYPSISGSYVFTEDLFKDSSLFSFGKIRLSWAEVGKGTNFGVVGHNYVADGDFPFNGVGGYRSSTVEGDPNIVPEKTRSWEIGADLRFFKNRLRIDYAYYSSTVNNQIFSVPQAASTGRSTIYRNAGDFKTWGHELLVSGDVIKTEDFKWELIYNFNTSEGEVIDLPDDVEVVEFARDFGPEYFLQVKEGDKMGSLYGWKWRRENGERYIDANGYPIIDESNGYEIVGNAFPDFTMSIGSNFTWKNFGLNFLVEWKEGGDKYDWSRRNMIRNGTSKVTELRNIDDYVLEGVMDDPNNPGSYIPNTTTTADGLDESYYRSYTRFTGASDVYLQDASWVKLRNIGITYDLSQEFISKVGITSFVLSASAHNIILWTPYDGYDPEGSSYSAGSNVYGFGGLGIPLTENYSVGVKIGF